MTDRVPAPRRGREVSAGVPRAGWPEVAAYVVLGGGLAAYLLLHDVEVVRGLRRLVDARPVPMAVLGWATTGLPVLAHGATSLHRAALAPRGLPLGRLVATLHRATVVLAAAVALPLAPHRGENPVQEAAGQDFGTASLVALVAVPVWLVAVFATRGGPPGPASRWRREGVVGVGVPLAALVVAVVLAVVRSG